MAGAGSLDRPIEIHRATSHQDEFGQEIKSWQLLYSLWASYKPLTGSESKIVEGVTSTSDAIFEIRFRPGVSPKMRVKMRDQWWEIEAVHEPNRNDRLLLICHTFDHTS